ncbi:14439_t:CDS:2, partial [Cetraspora pellucida]
MWYRTRWTSLYFTTDSILCARPVFDWILIEHRDIITNVKVLILLTDEKFFTNCRQTKALWTSNKETEVLEKQLLLLPRFDRVLTILSKKVENWLHNFDVMMQGYLLMVLEEDLSNLEEVSENVENMQASLLIGKIVNLSQYDIENEIISTGYDAGNMEYSPEQLVDEFLAKESTL